MLDRLKTAIEQSLIYADLASEIEIPLKIALSQIEANPEDLTARLQWLMTEAFSSFECHLDELRYELQRAALEVENLEKEQGHE